MLTCVDKVDSNWWRRGFHVGPDVALGSSAVCVEIIRITGAVQKYQCFFRRSKHPRLDMGLTISSVFSQLFGKKQMRILMGEWRLGLANGNVC